jgi:hypothetical protein
MSKNSASGISGSQNDITAPFVSRPQVTLVIWKMRDQARVEGLNPAIWTEDDYTSR